MSKFIIVLAVTGVLFLVSACASLNEPPTTLYPDRQTNPSAYKIDPLP